MGEDSLKIEDVGVVNDRKAANQINWIAFCMEHAQRRF